MHGHELFRTICLNATRSVVAAGPTLLEPAPREGHAIHPAGRAGDSGGRLSPGEGIDLTRLVHASDGGTSQEFSDVYSPEAGTVRPNRFFCTNMHPTCSLPTSPSRGSTVSSAR
jgi:hypothetical protein